MGTSTNYNAPTSPQWKTLKAKTTRIARQARLGPTDLKGIVQDFVKVSLNSSRVASSGGSTGLGRSAQDVAHGIGQFFSSIADIGFREAFEQLGLGTLEGKSVQEIGYSLVEHLGGPGSTIEEADARAALSNLMNEILSDAESLDDVEETMETKSRGELLYDLIQRFFSYYIFEQFCRVFYERLVNRVGDIQADAFIDSIRDYIFEAVKDVARHKDVGQIDWAGSQGKQIIDDILEETLEIFGG